MDKRNASDTLKSKGMIAVTSAQFFSAFGDNALLFATLALLKQQIYPGWSQPLLQMGFVATYIILAPFVGQIADSFSKGRVMQFANALKLFGALVICCEFNPFLGYSLVGIGAAAYSPAKYGILTELTSGEQLVRANGVIEASTIAAILLGSVAGGAIADWSIIAALIICVLAYLLALIANLLIPRLPPARIAHGICPRCLPVSTMPARYCGMMARHAFLWWEPACSGERVLRCVFC